MTSAATFAQWFDDVLGTNLAMAHTITLTPDFAGVYEYLDDSFYPIDSRLLGDEGHPHNDCFTYAFDLSFTYEACTDQFVEFRGGDGVWLFVDGQLVMDLGGVDTFTELRVEMDRLGLDDGSETQVHLFYAQRRTDGSEFRLRTNIPFETGAVALPVTAAFD